jgi:hypothetical protein
VPAPSATGAIGAARLPASPVAPAATADPATPAGPAGQVSLAGALAAVTAAFPRPAPGRRRRLCLAGLYYLVAAVAVTMWLWRDPASRIVAANPYDSDQFAWFFRYDATAVAHLHLPALTTAGLNAPRGINLMWNTPMLVPGIVLAPLTLLAGPQASLTVLVTLGFAGSALALHEVLRGWGASGRAAALGGLLYGFSPALIGSAQGHDDLQFAVLPPLIVDAILRLATGHGATGRRAAVRRGAWLGLLAAAQIFITEELLFDAGVTALIALAVLAAARPRAVRLRAGDLLAGGAVAVAVTALLAGYALREQFLGPIRQHGSPFTPDYYKSDLAGLVQPSSALLLHTRGSAAFAAAFRGQSPEYLSYLGWPLLITLAAIAVLLWRRPAVHVAAVTWAALEVLGLGGTLLAGGHEHPGLKLPWYWLQTLPVTGAAIPDRFSILADGAAAALFALGLDAAWARWASRPAPPEPASPLDPADRPATAGWRRTAGRWVIAVVALAALVPLVPRPLPAGQEPAVPPGWTAAFTALRLPAGARVLVLPIPVSTYTEPLRWAADTGWPAEMIGGYFMGPTASGQAATDGSGLSPAGLYLDRLWARATAGAGATVVARQADHASVTRAGMRAQLAAWDPAAVVAVTGPRSALVRYLTGLLGPPAVTTGTVVAWRPR